MLFLLVYTSEKYYFIYLELIRIIYWVNEHKTINVDMVKCGLYVSFHGTNYFLYLCDYYVKY